MAEGLLRMVHKEDVMKLDKYYEETPDASQYGDMMELCMQVVAMDVDKLHDAQEHYGDSWKKRGGVGAFMMLARKWDRLENQVGSNNWDVFEVCKKDTRVEGVIDDIRDLRRYLTLVEAELLRQERNGKFSGS